MPVRPAACVVVLTPRDQVREDIGPLVTMYRNLGSDSASAMVNHSLSELGLALGRIAEGMARQGGRDLRPLLTQAQRLAESLGFVTLALVCTDLVTCLGQGDATAAAAVWARLCRVAEHALSP